MLKTKKLTSKNQNQKIKNQIKKFKKKKTKTHKTILFCFYLNIKINILII